MHAPSTVTKEGSDRAKTLTEFAIAVARRAATKEVARMTKRMMIRKNQTKLALSWNKESQQGLNVRSTKGRKSVQKADEARWANFEHSVAQLSFVLTRMFFECDSDD